MSLAVAKNLVEQRAELTLLAGEVELGVVGHRLGQVQLDEPDKNVGQGKLKQHLISRVTFRIKYFRVGSGSAWLRSGLGL